jgi:hypothetical protein
MKEYEAVLKNQPVEASDDLAGQQGRSLEAGCPSG